MTEKQAHKNARSTAKNILPVTSSTLRNWWRKVPSRNSTAGYQKGKRGGLSRRTKSGKKVYKKQAARKKK